MTMRWLKQCRSVGVLLVKRSTEPLSDWRVELGRHTKRSWYVRSPHSAGRRAEGLVRIHRGPDLLACEFDFEMVPKTRPVAAEELPATRG